LTSKAYLGAYQKFVSTKEGSAFIARYQPGGDRENDILILRETGISADRSGHYGTTITSLRKYSEDSRFNWVTQKEDYEAGTREVIELSSGLDQDQATFTLGHETLIHVQADANNLNIIDEALKNKKYEGKEGNKKLQLDCINLMFDVAARDHKNYKNDLNKEFKNYVFELGQKFKDKYEENKKKYDENGNEK
jgi:hypothetical protein